MPYVERAKECGAHLQTSNLLINFSTISDQASSCPPHRYVAGRYCIILERSLHQLKPKIVRMTCAPGSSYRRGKCSHRRKPQKTDYILQQRTIQSCGDLTLRCGQRQMNILYTQLRRVHLISILNRSKHQPNLGQPHLHRNPSTSLMLTDVH